MTLINGMTSFNALLEIFLITYLMLLMLFIFIFFICVDILLVAFWAFSLGTT